MITCWFFSRGTSRPILTEQPLVPFEAANNATATNKSAATKDNKNVPNVLKCHGDGFSGMRACNVQRKVEAPARLLAQVASNAMLGQLQ